MAVAALMEEELQNSLATSEEDAEFEEDDELAGDLSADNADTFAANNQLHNGMLAEQSVGDEDEGEDNEDEEMLSDEDAEGEEDEEMADSAPNNGEEESEEEDDDEEEDEEEEPVNPNRCM